MKKYLILLVAAISTTFFVGCSSDDDFTPPNYVTFAEGSMSYAVAQNGSGSFDVTVYTANITGSDRTFEVAVASTSSADAASYTVPATVVVPGGSNEATFSVDVTDTNIDNAGETLILTIGAADAYSGQALTINLTRDCPSELAGTYSVVSSGSSTDPGVANATIVDFPYEVEIVKTGINSYTISDAFGGLYIDWYCDLYGYCMETEGSFTDVCGNLSGSFTEGFEAGVELTGTVNNDGTLTIDWVNDYGDEATAVYTLKQ